MPDDDAEVIDLAPEEAPRRGDWADVHDDVLSTMSAEDIEAGERVGQLIDIDDDDDNGLQYIGGPPR